MVGNGISKIDVTTSQTSDTFTARELREIPVDRDPVSVAELTSSAAPGGGAFNGLPSFGGSSVGENSFYINGFDVTNLFDNLSFNDLPFESIANEQVLTGGYGPNTTVPPAASSASPQARQQPVRHRRQRLLEPQFPARPRAGGVLRHDHHADHAAAVPQLLRQATDQTEANAWVSGPIIQDHLFYYVLLNKT